ncbi:MAG: sensor histidine kinase, partial [Bacteroidota bacterium]
IILNLLNNAIDAVSDLPNKWIRLEMKQESDSFVVRITDSGTGIPENVVKRIFDPFYTTKTAGKGTGLGLSISRNLAQANGAILEYDARSTNTCFVLKFPL